jgi:hypothetical protein
VETTFSAAVRDPGSLVAFVGKRTTTKSVRSDSCCAVNPVSGRIPLEIQTGVRIIDDLRERFEIVCAEFDLDALNASYALLMSSALNSPAVAGMAAGCADFGSAQRAWLACASAALPSGGRQEFHRQTMDLKSQRDGPAFLCIELCSLMVSRSPIWHPGAHFAPQPASLWRGPIADFGANESRSRQRR